MESTGAPCCLETIAGHDFQRVLTQCGAIGRYQNMAVSLCQFEGIDEQLFEIVFNVKGFSSGRTGKSWWIKNNDIELFPFSRQSRQHRHDIIGQKVMIVS